MPPRQIQSDSEDEEDEALEYSTSVANKRTTQDNADDDDDLDESHQARPAKRARIDRRGSSDEEDEEEGEEEEDDEVADGMEVENIPRHSIIDEPPKPLQFGEDGFVEGSIVKLTLVNFVTYDYCEVYPGPQMNMIIGPNGTGKSTIVCAIALGLGGSPNLLGRAKNIAEFVKTGQDEAQITIELKKVDTRNVVIQRSFRKSNNATTWRVNGKQATQKEVLSIIQSFNIQVDNLCQFLPQDRVAEFAELSPPQLLARTQTAAGKLDLADMQKQLVDWRTKEKELITTNYSDIDHLKTLKTRNQELERDVLRMQERRRLELEIKLLEAQLPLVRYTESKKRSDELKEIYETEKEKVRQAKANVAPIQNFLRQCEEDQTSATTERNNALRTFKNVNNEVRVVNEKIKSQKTEISTKKKEIENYQRRLAERHKEIENAEKKIKFIENELQNKPTGDTAEIEEKIAEINDEINRLREKSADNQQEAQDRQRSQHALQQEANRKKQQLSDMYNVKKARLGKLQQEYPDTAKLCQYIRQHKDEFEAPIYDPVILCANLKDARYAAAVEQAMGGSNSTNFRAFICESQNDYRKLTAFAVDQQQWKVRIQWAPTSADDTKTPCSTEVLRSRFKMEYFVSDLLECPATVLRALCSDANIHRIPVALQGPNPAAVASSGIFQKFVIGQTYYNVKSSLYGKKSRQIMTTHVRKEKWFGESVDTEGINALKDELRSLQSNLGDLESELKEYAMKHDQIKRQLEEKKLEKDELMQQKRHIQIAHQRHAQNQQRLVKFKRDLVELQQKPEQDQRKIEELQREIEVMGDQEEQLLAKYEDYVAKAVELHEKLMTAALKYIHCSARYHTVRQFAKQHSQELERAEAEMNRIKVLYAQASNEVKQHMQRCRDAGRGLPEELSEKWAEVLNTWKTEGLSLTTEELENQIVDAQGKKNGIRFANPHAMEHYEARKREITRLEEKIENNRQVLEDFQAKINELKNKWAPMIYSLVERINEKFTAAFQRIRCVGAVSVQEHPDFDKWGINIHVKFRENEKLQLLTGQRQSGGERSVTTILYLMSLQDLAKSPFRVVDEINQGMDPRNERMIHEQIVKSASRPGTSQYFLITPKLLPDLYYNERMRVLCIYNGEWLPTKLKPLSHYLENARKTAQA